MDKYQSHDQRLRRQQYLGQREINQMNGEKLDEMHTTVSKQMLPFMEVIIKADEDPCLSILIVPTRKPWIR